ncbi:MAG: hypothetical protein QXF12_05505, partial [Candidatus Aenigmatarchaeota archaeon]
LAIKTAFAISAHMKNDTVFINLERMLDSLFQKIRLSLFNISQDSNYKFLGNTAIIKSANEIILSESERLFICFKNRESSIKRCYFDSCKILSVVFVKLLTEETIFNFLIKIYDINDIAADIHTFSHNKLPDHSYEILVKNFIKQTTKNIKSIIKKISKKTKDIFIVNTKYHIPLHLSLYSDENEKSVFLTLKEHFYLNTKNYAEINLYHRNINFHKVPDLNESYVVFALKEYCDICHDKNLKKFDFVIVGSEKQYAKYKINKFTTQQTHEFKMFRLINRLKLNYNSINNKLKQSYYYFSKYKKRNIFISNESFYIIIREKNKNINIKTKGLLITVIPKDYFGFYFLSNENLAEESVILDGYLLKSYIYATLLTKFYYTTGNFLSFYKNKNLDKSYFTISIYDDIDITEYLKHNLVILFKDESYWFLSIDLTDQSEYLYNNDRLFVYTKNKKLLVIYNRDGKRFMRNLLKELPENFRHNVNNLFIIIRNTKTNVSIKELLKDKAYNARLFFLHNMPFFVLEEIK